MSDITGPPLPKPVDPVNRPTGRASGVSKDPQKQDAQTRNERGDTSAKENAEHARAREPAISISATAAHLHIGEELKEHVNQIDNEGRPIIVTETATFALRPDAGLRPGDDVRLEIVDAGKTLHADLLEKNGRPISPPVRLSLIVIALHQKEGQSQSSQPASTEAPLPSSPRYAPTSVQKAHHTPLPVETERLANILASSRQTIPAPSLPTINVEAQTHKPPLQSTLQSTTQLTANPDLTTNRSSSPDLATLIAAQQNTSSKQVPSAPLSAKAPQSDPVSSPINSQTVGVDSPLPASPEATISGLGPAIKAYSVSGHEKTLQLLDPSTSKVPPQQVATVNIIRPLSPDEAKTIPVPLNSFSPTSGTLAMVETTQGNFVAPMNTASNLAGEFVKVGDATSQPENSQQAPAAPDTATTETPKTGTAKIYSGKLQASPNSTKQPVSLVFEQPTSPDNSFTAKVKGVHTLRAFLSPTGPHTDFRLETTRGELFVTLPNAEGPASGDTVGILLKQLQPLQAQGVTPSTEQASSLASTTALTSQGVHIWPALSQAYSLLSTTAPDAAASLAGKGAASGSNLTNSLLFFLAASGRGDPGGWLGKDVEQALEIKSRSLLETLKADVGKLMATAATETAGEWRSLLLPLDIRQPDSPLIAFLFGNPHKHHDDEGNNGRDSNPADENTGQRFILEIQFSILGPVQLDGTISQQRFDLTLRSQKKLPNMLCDDARHLFLQALEANGYAGQLRIDEEKPFPVIVKDILAENLDRVSA